MDEIDKLGASLAQFKGGSVVVHADGTVERREHTPEESASFVETIMGILRAPPPDPIIMVSKARYEAIRKALAT